MLSWANATLALSRGEAAERLTVVLLLRPHTAYYQCPFPFRLAADDTARSLGKYESSIRTRVNRVRSQPVKINRGCHVPRDTCSSDAMEI